ncbi:MAG: aldose 1-epimerase family protein [Eubacteriales bacterium]|nr:aldose 1-epimerase family protein [Eubacteriales bacterium]
MEKKKLYQYIGNMQQLAYVRPVECEEGRAENMKVLQVKNGPLSYQVMADKCLDVAEVSYKGVNINFLSKPGLQGRNHYDTNGEEALRSIMGGFFFTAGMENICAPCTVEGKDYPMHGRVRTTPAEHVCRDAFWDGENYVLKVSGEMREAELFGENMVLRREISSVYGENSITVRDEITNEAYRPEPLMLLYHINMGYPFLSEDTRLYIPTKEVTPRDEASKGHEDGYDRMDAPKPNEPEYVFIHDLMTDEDGNTQILVINEVLQIGMKLCYNTKYLPYFMEWKSTAAGDYVIGLEPSNSSVYGRPFHEKNGGPHMLAPFEKEENRLTFAFFDGRDEIEKEVCGFKKKFHLQ